MKTRFTLLILLALALPMVLAACGGGDADTAKKYVEAVADGDKDEAEKHVCDDKKDELLAGTDEKMDIKDLKCEEDGDDVKCTFKSDLNFLDEETKVEMVFGMKDGKVCELKSSDTPDLDFGDEGDTDEGDTDEGTTDEGDTDEGTTDEGDTSDAGDTGDAADMTADAETAVVAIISGNAGDAAEYFCEDDSAALEAIGANSTAVEGATFTADCTQDGDTVTCSTAMDMAGTSTPLASYSMNIVDGKFCGFSAAQ